MKSKSRKTKVTGIIIGVALFIANVCCACTSLKSSNTQTSNENSVTSNETVETISTTESKQEKEKSKDKNDLSGYYGKSVHEIEKILGYELEKDGSTYYSGNYFIGVDEDDNIISITIMINSSTDANITFEGINAQDTTIEDAAKKLEANGYILDEEEGSSYKIYKNKSDMIVSLNATSEEEYILDYMSNELYIARKEEYENNVVDSEGYYITDTATGSTIETHVYYAYTQNEYDNNIVKVVCEITNVSDDSIVFDARDYYELDNDGLIVDVNMTDYDYKEISAGYSFKATLAFTCPSGSNTDLSCMNMTADGLIFNLGDKPQSEEEKKEFYGIYNWSDSKMIISDNYDGTYTICDIMFILGEPDVDVYNDVTLDEDNSFVIDGRIYIWYPEEYTFYLYDRTDGEIDYDINYVKN